MDGSLLTVATIYLNTLTVFAAIPFPINFIQTKKRPIFPCNRSPLHHYCCPTRVIAPMKNHVPINILAMLRKRKGSALSGVVPVVIVRITVVAGGWDRLGSGTPRITPGSGLIRALSERLCPTWGTVKHTDRYEVIFCGTKRL